MEYLAEIEEELIEEHGKMPLEVKNLFKIIELKILAKEAGVINIRGETVPMSKEKEIVVQFSKKITPANIVNMLDYNSSWAIIGMKFRVNVKDLGENWFEGLKKSVLALGGEAKHGK